MARREACDFPAATVGLLLLAARAVSSLQIPHCLPCPVLSCRQPRSSCWRHTNPTCRVHRLACPPKFQSQAAEAEQASHKFPDQTNQRTSSAVVALQAGLPSRQVWIRSSPKKTKPVRRREKKCMVSSLSIATLRCSALLSGEAQAPVSSVRLFLHHISQNKTRLSTSNLACNPITSLPLPNPQTQNH